MNETEVISVGLQQCHGNVIHNSYFLNNKREKCRSSISLSPPLVGGASLLSTPAAWGHVSLLAP